MDRQFYLMIAYGIGFAIIIVIALVAKRFETKPEPPKQSPPKLE